MSSKALCDISPHGLFIYVAPGVGTAITVKEILLVQEINCEKKGLNIPDTDLSSN